MVSPLLLADCPQSVGARSEPNNYRRWPRSLAKIALLSGSFALTVPDLPWPLAALPDIVGLYLKGSAGQVLRDEAGAFSAGPCR